MMNIYDEADLMTVLSRLSRRHLTLLKAPASKEQLEVSANGRVLLSAIGSSSE
jgi:hypothetical protein